MCGRVKEQTRNMRGRCGFTLIELLVTMGVLTLVMAAMTSMMLATAKALPSAADADVKLDADDRALREALWLLADAKTIVVSESDEVSFKAPDIDNDTKDEDVTLRFAGDSGDPLIMELNGTDVEIVQDVESVQFAFSWRERAGTTVSGTYETAEMLLDGWSGASDATRECSLSRTLAMRLSPQLPHDATQFRITRARYFVKPIASKSCIVSMSIADATAGGLPDLTRVRTTATTTHTGLASGGAWVSQVFASNTHWHAATERPFLWGGTTSLASEFELAVQTIAPHAGEFVYSQAFQSPEVSTPGAMLFEVYGVVRRPNVIANTVMVASGLHVTVQRMDGTTVRCVIPLRNEPVLP
jgi:prepilin-type N-terminal cleavage/methylation domain-containing protein